MDEDYYAVLGVEPKADPDEIRRVYVSLARRHHPDLQGDDAVVGAAAERRMQRINEAWAVLSDTDRRESYDLVIAGRSDGAGRVVQEPERREWQPLDGDHDDDDDIDPRDLIEDIPIGDGGRIPRVMQMAPPLLVFGGILLLIVGMMTALMPIVVLAVSALSVGALLFVATPFVAVLRSRTSERNATV